MWLVATAVIVGGLVGETPAAGAVSAVPLVSGAELRLPQPSAWPCIIPSGPGSRLQIDTHPSYLEPWVGDGHRRTSEPQCSAQRLRDQRCPVRDARLVEET
jgi:hypothetical protein